MDQSRSHSESAAGQVETRRVSFSPNTSRKDLGVVHPIDADQVENGWIRKRSRFASGSSSHSHSRTLVVELYDLRRSLVSEWVQLGRWIKYEEAVEGTDGRFGRPKFPVLCYHSTQLLSKYLPTAVFLPDVEAESFGDVILAMAEAFAEKFDMRTKGAKSFMEAFGNDLKRIPGDSTDMRKYSMTEASVATRKPSALLEAIEESGNDSEITSDSLRRKSAAAPKRSSHGHIVPGGLAPPAEKRRSISVGALPFPVQRARKMSKRQQIARKLSAVGGGHNTKRTIDYVQEGAEACQLFTGVIPELKDVRLAFARLTKPITVPESMDALPIRFVIAAVGPSLIDVHYAEIGRAFATLMANADFQDIAYLALDKADLLRGMHEFLDVSVVIPPGEIYKNDLMHVEDVRKTLRSRRLQKANMIKQRKESEFSQGDTQKPGEDILETTEPESKSETEPTTGIGRPWERTGRPFGGLIRDIRQRAPLYFSDFKDALNLQCISSTIFMFFVAFAPAISFGQVMNERFEGLMGIIEVFVAQGVGGIVWALFAGQPLLIQAATGPFLVFESAMYQFCKHNGIEFLPTRVWVGVWTFIISVLIVLAEGSFMIGYVTRFTEDIFTLLIAGIFIVEAAKFIFDTFTDNPLLPTSDYCSAYSPFDLSNMTDLTTPANSTIAPPPEDHDQPNTALLSMVLVLGTFLLAFILKRVRTSHFFGRTIRKALGDFGVPLTILVMVLITKLALNQTYLEFIDMPPTFGLTQPTKRPWFIPPMGINQTLPTWVIGAAIIPAFLISILFFVETEIIQLLLTSKERGLKKPMGFHWDLVLSGGLIFGVSLFGLPWMCAAAVQSLTHATSLTVMKKAAPGEKPKVDYVVEQRVTTMLVAIMIGACSFLGEVLRNIPIAVLLGVFLYLGISCLLNVQFIHRLVLLFIPRKYFPELPYCKQVSMWRMHAYTLIQLVAFIVLWVVHSIQQTALVFPFVIALEAVMRRFLLTRIFSQSELEAIDASDAHGEGEMKDEDDFYDEIPLPM